jgi:hypothetical protein
LLAGGESGAARLSPLKGTEKLTAPIKSEYKFYARRARPLSRSHKTNFAESALSFTLDLFEIIPALLLLCEESAFRVRLNADPYLARGMSLCATRRFAHSAALSREASKV